jgi:hypothetical protein
MRTNPGAKKSGNQKAQVLSNLFDLHTMVKNDRKES